MNTLRRPRFWFIGVPVLAVLAYLAFGVFGIQYAVIDKQVSESFPTPRPAAAAAVVPAVAPPTLTPQPTATSQATPQPSTVAAAQTAAPTATNVPPTVPPTATNIPPTEVPSEPVLVRSGDFHNVEHDSSGKALIYRNPDGTYLLRLEGFSVDNGPDLYVYAIAAKDATDSPTVANSQFLNVAKLKGNIGDQNYILPAEFDPNVHQAVSIWCRRFSVNFATAPLQ